MFQKQLVPPLKTVFKLSRWRWKILEFPPVSPLWMIQSYNSRKTTKPSSIKHTNILCCKLMFDNPSVFHGGTAFLFIKPELAEGKVPYFQLS